jgi:hypothetical protein
VNVVQSGILKLLLCALLLSADVLYLFGKVSASSNGSDGAKGGSNSWQSCCVVVPNLHRSLLVVPRPEVFEDADGEIAALETAVAADPARKIELLQVRWTFECISTATACNSVVC